MTNLKNRDKYKKKSRQPETLILLFLWKKDHFICKKTD
ncbi:hypothetical protein BACIT_3012 [Bacillus amyloliquefaciens]|nr:hypothetical protein U471_27090 [Bacillus amyloliquefaciens CC178]QEY90870.1 hypothetical protein BACIT_3012 [Bacillus amyloliquefaciens]